jgi:hypothetical protein
LAVSRAFLRPCCCSATKVMRPNICDSLTGLLLPESDKVCGLLLLPCQLVLAAPGAGLLVLAARMRPITILLLLQWACDVAGSVVSLFDCLL